MRSSENTTGTLIFLSVIQSILPPAMLSHATDQPAISPRSMARLRAPPVVYPEITRNFAPSVSFNSVAH